MAYREDRSAIEHEIAELRAALAQLSRLAHDPVSFEAKRVALEHESERLQARLRGELHEPSLVRRLKIVRACDASWEHMQGTASVRHCQLCDQRVYSLDAMTMLEVEAMVRAANGEVCARLRRRRDGRIVTAECMHAENEQRLRRRTLRVAAVVAAVLAGTAALSWYRASQQVTMGRLDHGQTEIGPL